MKCKRQFGQHSTKASKDQNSQHAYCPAGSTNWCKWRRAEAEGKLADYMHPPPLNAEVLKLIKPVYKNLVIELL